MTPDEQMSALLKGLGDRAVELNTWFFGPVDVHRVRGQLGLTRNETDEAMAMLVEKRIVELRGDGIGSFSSGNLTDAGLDCHMQACRPGYPPSARERPPLLSSAWRGSGRYEYR